MTMQSDRNASAVRRTAAGFYRRLVTRRLQNLVGGRLVLSDARQPLEFGSLTADDAIQAELHVTDDRFYRQLVFGGVLGAAEAFRQGHWTSPDLVNLVRLFSRNAGLSRMLDGRVSRILRPVRRLTKWLSRNSRNGSRRNIAAHYDLGNDFFAKFLDETLSYSSAIFERPSSSLYEASLAKNDRICRKLDLSPEDHVLEIGSGWGGFALHAASNYGCRVTTTTISNEQYNFVCQRVQEAGLRHRIRVLNRDYRDLSGSFDKLVSVEMIEAVGHSYLDRFFRICAECLKPDGIMLLQTITIPEHRYDAYRRNVDFIQRYIFPGGHLPSAESLIAVVNGATDLAFYHSEQFAPHYALTLQEWRERFCAKRQELLEMGFSNEFIRTWEFYFCYCEGGFREECINVAQMVFSKPHCSPPAILPPLADTVASD